MKRPHFKRPNTKRVVGLVRWPLFFLLIAAGAAAIAVASLGISLSSSSIGVHSGATVTATGPVTSSTICSAGTGSYGQTVAIAWGNVTTGTKVQEYICVQNTGTGTSNPIAVSSTLAPNYGTISSPEQEQPSRLTVSSWSSLTGMSYRPRLLDHRDQRSRSPSDPAPPFSSSSLKNGVSFNLY
jgi:hypothetical protein